MILGPIGLLNLLTAKAMGARVCITDIDAQRLEMAKRIGADHVVLVEKQQTAQSLTDAIHSLMTPDVSIECTGAEQPTQTAIMVFNGIADDDRDRCYRRPAMAEQLYWSAWAVRSSICQ